MKTCNKCNINQSIDKFRNNCNSCRKCNNKQNINAKLLSGYEKEKTNYHITNITKKYVAKLLKISVLDLTDELYVQYKKNIEFKRIVVKENNINIQKINHYGR